MMTKFNLSLVSLTIVLLCECLFTSCGGDEKTLKHYNTKIIVSNNISSSATEKLPDNILRFCIDTFSNKEFIYIANAEIIRVDQKEPYTINYQEPEKDIWSYGESFSNKSEIEKELEKKTDYYTNVLVGSELPKMTNLNPKERWEKINKFCISDVQKYFFNNKTKEDTIEINTEKYKVYKDVGLLRQQMITDVFENKLENFVIIYEPPPIELIDSEKINKLNADINNINEKVNSLKDCIWKTGKKIESNTTYNNIAPKLQEINKLFQTIKQQNKENNPDITNSINKADEIIKTFQDKFLQMEKECERISKPREPQPKPQPKPIIPVKEESDDRIKKLEDRLNYYKAEYQKAIDENDTLKGQISMIQQQIQRAKQLEQQRKLEAVKNTQAIIDEQLNELLSKMEKKMSGLIPENIPPKIITKTDTIVKTVTTTVTDYNATAQGYYDKAVKDEETARKQPERYFLSRNRTKTDFVQSVSDSYNNALTNFNLANNKDMIKETEKKIKEFNTEFSKHLKK